MLLDFPASFFKEALTVLRSMCINASPDFRTGTPKSEIEQLLNLMVFIGHEQSTFVGFIIR